MESNPLSNKAGHLWEWLVYLAWAIIFIYWPVIGGWLKKQILHIADIIREEEERLN